MSRPPSSPPDWYWLGGNNCDCWGMPSLNKVVWVVAQLLHQKYNTDGASMESCPLVQDRETDVILEIPILVLLVLNFLFLIWVIIVRLICSGWLSVKWFSIQIVVAKLNQRTVLDHEKRHFKAAKVHKYLLEYINYKNKHHKKTSQLAICTSS